MTTGAVAYTPEYFEDQAYYSPPPEFKALVEREIHEADDRAHMLLPKKIEPPPEPKRTDGRPINYKGPGSRKTKNRTDRKCIGCGCPFDDYTAGCRNCRARHKYRRKYSPSPIERKCKGCGCSVDDFTADCHNCYSRHKQRRHSAAQGKV